MENVIRLIELKVTEGRENIARSEMAKTALLNDTLAIQQGINNDSVSLRKLETELSLLYARFPAVTPHLQYSATDNGCKTASVSPQKKSYRPVEDENL